MSNNPGDLLRLSDVCGRWPIHYGIGLLCSLMLASFSLPVAAQSVGDAVRAAPINVPSLSAPSPGVLPTDATKPPINEDRALINPGWRLRLRQRLPARLWFTSVTEVSNRLDTNVFLQYKEPQPDYVFRVQPNITVGYNIFDKTSVYANWFLIKDTYTVHPKILNFPTTQSVSMGLRHQLYSGKKFGVQLDCQARELFQNKGLRQADLLPSVSMTYFLTPKSVLFASVLLQMRSGQLFQGPTRELDPFYTVGYVARKGQWTFTFTDTLVTNFREPHFPYSRPRHGNVSMIADFEVARPVMKKYPGLQAYLRAEPVFNWRSAKTPGLSGFDFRLYGGLRLLVSKPSYIGTIHKLKQQLRKQEEEAKKLRSGAGAVPGATLTAPSISQPAPSDADKPTGSTSEPPAGNTSQPAPSDASDKPAGSAVDKPAGSTSETPAENTPEAQPAPAAPPKADPGASEDSTSINVPFDTPIRLPQKESSASPESPT